LGFIIKSGRNDSGGERDSGRNDPVPKYGASDCCTTPKVQFFMVRISYIPQDDVHFFCTRPTSLCS
jgi:hypothetical protein